jgi:hypothetical protein
MVKHISFVSKDNIKVNLDIETRPLSPNREVRDWETLETVKEPVELSISGNCGGHGGQIYDAFEPTEAQARLVEFWKQYHLNGAKSGTRKQMEAIENHQFIHIMYDYKEAVEYLKSIGLYEDRGYKYGTGWLYRSFPQDELEAIIADIEREEEERTAGFEYPDFADDEEALAYISEHTDLDPEHVLAIIHHTGMSMSEIGEIEEDATNLYTVYGTEYYVGADYELQEIAREYIDRSMWVDAVVGGYTNDSFEDWVDELIEEDLGGILNSWDGTLDYEYVNDNEYAICRAS